MTITSILSVLLVLFTSFEKEALKNQWNKIRCASTEILPGDGMDSMSQVREFRIQTNTSLFRKIGA